MSIEQNLEDDMINKHRKIHTVEVGDYSDLVIEKVGKGLFSYNRTVSFMYSGMPDDKRFVISTVKKFSGGESSYGGFAHVYYPIDKEQIRILGNQFRIIDVNPDEILLQYIGKMVGENG